VNLDKGSGYFAELEEVSSVVSREEPHVELFTIEHRDFVVLLSSPYFNKVCKCEVLKGGDVPRCEDTPRDRGLCTGIVGWHES